MTMIEDIRTDLGDDGATVVFSDAQYITLIQKSARRVNRELCLTDTDDEIVISASGEVTTPDDDDLRDLVLLKAECLILQRGISAISASTSSIDGIRVTDGEQTLDTTGRITSKQNFLNSDFNPCFEYKNAITSEKLKRTCGYDIW